MFKKTEPEVGSDEPTIRHHEPAAPPARGNGSATIGPSIKLRGDLTGEEDLIVQGAVEGTVSLPENLLTIGKDGQLNATVNARVINVEGRVEGDLHGTEQVVLQRSANVQGNISAPRVTLEDGCQFKGSIDMNITSNDKSKGATAYANQKVADLKPPAAGDSKPKPGMDKGGTQQASRS